ncbi:hypothetical protein LWI29_014835 [Acer saccharum]|uniref:Uncharacterized protein n=1 Tax=Acer saccharum TaxID=4024 RepID=A0AA39RQD0_ACESA|nr:hypothetical protein LWI29_014835 [Acer saccharum]
MEKMRSENVVAYEWLAEWQLTGIPCIHGISTLLSSNRDLIDYIHNKYKKENFIEAYAPRGRPKKARAFQADEIRVGGKSKLRRNYVVVRCSMCKQEGHNKSTCERRSEGNLDGLKQDKKALKLKVFKQVKDQIKLIVFKQVKEPIRLEFFKQVKEAD